MNLFFSHTSAYCHWRSTSALMNPSEPTNLRQAHNCAYSKAHLEVAPLKKLNVGAAPHDVLVDKPSKRNATLLLNAHMATSQMPKGSFHFLRDQVYVVSPELSFMQMAEELSLVHLIKYGFELCGNYCLLSNDTVGFAKRKPVTSAKAIQKFLERVPKGQCSSNAKKAAKLLIDGSASPKETQLAILLTLPYKLGGYGFSQPQMNPEIVLQPNIARMAGSKLYRCDLYWPDKRVAVEYDSDAFHTGADRIAADSRRRNVLNYLDITVVTVTREQLMSAKDLFDIAQQLSKHLDKKLRMDKAAFSLKHQELRRQLFRERPFIPESLIY